MEPALYDVRLVKEAWKQAGRVQPIKSGWLNVMSSACWEECRNVAGIILSCDLANDQSMYAQIQYIHKLIFEQGID